MGDYYNTSQVAVPPAALFGYLATIENLPDYFPRMRSVERVDGGGERDTVHTSAEMPDGQIVEGEAWMEVDDERLTIQWGAEGPRDYHGRLSVTGSGGGAQVEVVISTEHVESDEVQRGVDATVANIKSLVESRHTGVEQ